MDQPWELQPPTMVEGGFCLCAVVVVDGNGGGRRVDEVWMKCGRSVAEGGDAFGGVAPQEPDVPGHGMCWSACRSNGFTQFTPVFRFPGVSRLPPMPRAGGCLLCFPLDSHLISAHREADKNTIGGCAMDVARAGEEEEEEGTGRTGWLMVAPPIQNTPDWTGSVTPQNALLLNPSFAGRALAGVPGGIPTLIAWRSLYSVPGLEEQTP